MPRAAALVAAGSLPVGFAVADVSGVRALGGLVLVAAAAVCVVLWTRAAGAVTAGLLLALYVAAFVGSHVLARWAGAWPSVLTVAVIVGAASVLATRRPAAPASPVLD